MKSIGVFLWTSFAVGAVLSVIAQVHSEDESRATPVVLVRRRQSGDIYNTTLSQQICDVDINATYLVKESQCISNHHLFNECSFVITPLGEFNAPRLLLNIKMENTSAIAQTTNVNDIINAVVTFRTTAELVNSSTCQISSLEVYRGRKQAIKIKHQGFSLTENGTIKIYIDRLFYKFEEYMGELYRMNLSCSGGGLPQSGCLFFKVFGTTNISEAKFNCTVPGTLPTNSSECSPTADDTATTTISDTQEPTTLPPSDFNHTITDSTTLVVSPPNTIEIGSPLFYGIVGAGATVIIVTLFCMICICIMLGCRRECKSNSIGPCNTTEQDLETKYAEIGAAYQEISPRTHNPKQPAWARTSSAVTNAGSEQPPQEYSTLVQVGGRQTLRNNLTNSMSDINSEQYAQLMISK